MHEAQLQLSDRSEFSGQLTHSRVKGQVVQLRNACQVGGAFRRPAYSYTSE